MNHDDRTRVLGHAPSLKTGDGVIDVGGPIATGVRIGPYRIEALIGEGGMGAVYRATQEEPFVREVALKLLNARRLSPTQAAMFEVERQVLAKMSHPAIAAIYDAGTSIEGRPYFAMEYVEGRALTEWCDENRLPLAARVDLMIRVCRGVQHAHQKGVIHRDLKPSNVLVTAIDGEPLPKIIDFGIAVATARTLGAEPIERVGTPLYMSPEQAGTAGFDLDTRSDVYSLGIVLHELLIGAWPKLDDDLRTGGTSSKTLTRPSSGFAAATRERQREIAERRRTGAKSLKHALIGDLDAIVAKATQYDRNLRYDSAALLADDLERWREAKPVSAMPATRAYVISRFVKRHRLAIAGSAAVLLALLIGLAASIYGFLEANQQRALAETRKAELEQVSKFQQSMLESIDLPAMGQRMTAEQRTLLARALERSEPDAARRALALSDFEAALAAASPTDVARSLIADAVLKRAETAIARDFSAQPALRHDLDLTVGKVYMALGAFERARELCAAMAERSTAAFGADDPRTLQAQAALGFALNRLGKTAEAEALLTEALARADRVIGPDANATLELALSLAINLNDQGRADASIALLDRVYTARAARFGPTANETLAVLGTRALSRIRAGDRDGAIADLRFVADTRRATLGSDHPETLLALGNLGGVLGQSGRFDEALPIQREVLAAGITLRGREHPLTLNELNNLASTLVSLDELDEALVLLEEAVATRSRVLGDRHPQTLRSRLNLSAVLTRLDRFDEAIAMLVGVVAVRVETLGPTHPDTLSARLNLASTRLRAGDVTGAERDARAAALAVEEAFPPNHPLTVEAELTLGTVLLEADQYAPALQRLELVLAALGAASPREPRYYDALGKAWRAALASGNRARADALRVEEIDPFLARGADTLSPAEQRARTDLVEEIEAPSAP